MSSSCVLLVLCRGTRELKKEGFKCASPHYQMRYCNARPHKHRINLRGAVVVIRGGQELIALTSGSAAGGDEQRQCEAKALLHPGRRVTHQALPCGRQIHYRQRVVDGGLRRGKQSSVNLQVFAPRQM